MQVRELMTKPPVLVGPDTPLRDVAALLSERHISGVPVVDRGRVVGVVSESDIVEKERGLVPAKRGLLDRLRGRPARITPAVTTAAEAMTSPPILVAAWSSDYHAAWLMSEHDVNRLPVVQRGRLVGVIARTDLVREIARSDAEIAQDIRERVLEPLELADVDVTVERGRVTLGGAVDLESDLDDLPHAVSQVPGVMSVEVRTVVRTPQSV